MPTFLVTRSPPATHPGLLARAGPEPSPRGAQGPQAGLGTPGANTSGIGSTAEQKETPRQARSCQLNATTGCTGVPAGCSAASTAGSGTRGHPVSPQPPPRAHPRLRGGFGKPKIWGPRHRYQPTHARTLPAARRATSAHVRTHGCRAQKRQGWGWAERAGSSPRRRWVSSAQPAPVPIPTRDTARPWLGPGAAAGDSPLQPIHHHKARRLVRASRFPPAVPQDAM